MHVISRKRLREFWKQHPDAQNPLESWYQSAKKATWQNLIEVQADFPHADLVGKCIIFNIGGNKYRLISKIYFDDQVCLVRFVLTHSEYDKDKWKVDCT